MAFTQAKNRKPSFGPAAFYLDVRWFNSKDFQLAKTLATSETNHL